MKSHEDKDNQSEDMAGEIQKPNKCSICGYSCSRKNDLKIHVESAHEGKKPHKCSICEYRCSRKSNLKQHVESVHEGKKSHVCYICEYSCSHSGALKKHMESVHEGKKSQKCSFCDNSFSLLTDGERLRLGSKLVISFVILAWAEVGIVFLDKRASCWGRSHIDIWHLCFRYTICSVRIISTGAHSLNNSFLSFLSNSKRFDV